MTTRLKFVLLFVILVIPAIVSLVTAKVAFTRAKTVDFCSSCHTMTPWIEDVTGNDSDSTAHDHFARRWIQHDQCYTCHSDYNFLGPVKAKVRGMRHLVMYYMGGFDKIEHYGPFPNANCLQCHAEAKGFLEEPSHDPVADLISDKDRCVECHETFHNVDQGGEADAEPADDDEAQPAAAGKAEAEPAAAGKAEAEPAASDKADSKPAAAAKED